MTRSDRARGTVPHLDERLTSYCFGSLSDEDRGEVEGHLLACDECWNEFQRLEAAVRTLRFDAALQPGLRVDEAVSLLCLSSRLTRPFGGHLAFSVTIASLFSLEWIGGLWSELGYSYDRFGTLAWILSLPVGLWVFGVLLLSLSADLRATRKGQTDGLARSAVTVLVGLGLLVAALMTVLPAEQTIRASFQTRTAAMGFLKDALVIFLPLLFFIIPPFHAVVRLQKELASGRIQPVINLLTRNAEAVAPRGMWYLPPRVLAVVLALLGTLKIVGANHMLDALSPGPYAGLFTLAAYLSTGLWLAIALACLIWYSTRLNELTREALALAAVKRLDSQGVAH